MPGPTLTLPSDDELIAAESADLAAASPTSIADQVWSVSRLQLLLACSARFYFHYVAHTGGSNSPALVFGKSLHHAAEFYYTRKALDHTAPPVIHVQRAYLAGFHAATTGEHVAPVEWGDTPRRVVRREGLNAVPVFVNQIGAQYAAMTIMQAGERVPLVEQRLLWDVDGVKFQGYIDLVDDAAIIHDLKTSARQPQPHTLDHSLQATAYWMGYRAQYGEEPQGFQFDYLIRKRAPETLTWSVSRSQADIDRFRRMVAMAVEIADRGLYLPNHQAMGCGPSCEAYDQCFGRDGPFNRLDPLPLR